jgi:(2Fe-2S) ferredoxin
VKAVARRKLLVCVGSHCRKVHARDHGVRDYLERLPVEIESVGCQKVCRSPVLGVEVDGAWQWFEGMDSKKALRALRELVLDDRLAKPLRKRRNEKRAGRVR